MTTWLIDTALFKTVATPRATCLRQWLDANDATLFLSAASLTELAAGIARTSANPLQRGYALRTWFDELVARFADRIHPVDPQIADSDEAGHAFRMEAGHVFRSEAGRDSDLMSATQRLLPRIEAMMFRRGGTVKRGVDFGPAAAEEEGRVGTRRRGGGG